MPARYSGFFVASRWFVALWIVAMGLAIAAPTNKPSGAASHAARVSSTPAPTASPTPAPFTAPELHFTILVIVALGLVALILLAYVALNRVAQGRFAQATTDKDLEALRIFYGYLLIIGALIVSLSVAIITAALFKPAIPGTADILAILTSVTGVIGTLVAAFFGIQAAGAGRSQALSALEKVQTQGRDLASEFTIDPSYGPHAGNTRVSVKGNGLTGATSVNFGTAEGANYQFINDGLVQATAPAVPEITGDVDVTVIYPTATPTNRKVGTYYYYTVRPTNGPVGQGTPVSIIGSGFTNANAVKFGAKQGTAMQVSPDGRRINVTAPQGDAAGDVDVTVMFPTDAATNSTVVGKFTYT